MKLESFSHSLLGCYCYSEDCESKVSFPFPSPSPYPYPFPYKVEAEIGSSDYSNSRLKLLRLLEKLKVNLNLWLDRMAWYDQLSPFTADSYLRPWLYASEWLLTGNDTADGPYQSSMALWFWVSSASTHHSPQSSRDEGCTRAGCSRPVKWQNVSWESPLRRWRSNLKRWQLENRGDERRSLLSWPIFEAL